MPEEVVLVDTFDNPIGTCEKQAAHVHGQLHRALSVFVFRSDGAWLLQQRNRAKYHSGGLWTNTCCSHPHPGEEVADGAIRRLREEMGMTCSLKRVFTFVYRKDFENGLCEHEFDHVFVGESDAAPQPDPAEVSAYRWVQPADLQREMAKHPERFTYWFRASFGKVQTLREEGGSGCPHYALPA